MSQLFVGPSQQLDGRWMIIHRAGYFVPQKMDGMQHAMPWLLEGPLSMDNFISPWIPLPSFTWDDVSSILCQHILDFSSPTPNLRYLYVSMGCASRHAQRLHASDCNEPLQYLAAASNLYEEITKKSSGCVWFICWVYPQIKLFLLLWTLENHDFDGGIDAILLRNDGWWRIEAHLLRSEVRFVNWYFSDLLVNIIHLKIFARIVLIHKNNTLKYLRSRIGNPRGVQKKGLNRYY